MALTQEQLAKINATYKRAASQAQQGLDFKPKAGTYEVRICEIPGAGDFVFQEFLEHQHPGNKKGVGTCPLSLGKDRCYYHELLEALAPLAERDDVLQGYLAQMSTGDRAKYAFKVFVRELDSPTWLGPMRWRMRLDMMLKFQPYFSKKWGDPTEISFEVTLVLRKKKFQGNDVLDISSVAPILNPDPMPEDVLRRHDIDVMKLLQPRDDDSITEALLDGPLGPYLRQVMEEDEAQAPPPPPKPQHRLTPKAAALPPPPPEPEPEIPDDGQEGEAEEGMEDLPQEPASAPPPPPTRRLTRAQAPATPQASETPQAPAVPPASVAPLASKASPVPQTAGMSPLERARALTRK